MFITYHFTGSWPNTALVLSFYKVTFEVAFFLKPFEILCKTNQDIFQLEKTLDGSPSLFLWLMKAVPRTSKTKPNF